MPVVDRVGAGYCGVCVFLPGLSSLAILAEAAASISEARTSNADLGGIDATTDPLES